MNHNIYSQLYSSWGRCSFDEYINKVNEGEINLVERI